MTANTIQMKLSEGYKVGWLGSSQHGKASTMTTLLTFTVATYVLPFVVPEEHTARGIGKSTGESPMSTY